METFTLHSYDGPASIGGIDFPRARFWEGAESGTEEVPVIRWWEGNVLCSRGDVPGLTPEWVASAGGDVVAVVLPDIGQGQVYVTAVTLTNGHLWEVQLRGTGPSPMG